MPPVPCKSLQGAGLQKFYPVLMALLFPRPTLCRAFLKGF
nr:MAG TPA: hypothetical protein [Caudoviricetes sp.]